MGNSQTAVFERFWAYQPGAGFHDGCSLTLRLYEDKTFKLNWLREIPGEFYRWNIFEGTFEVVGATYTFNCSSVDFISKGPWVVDARAVHEPPCGDYRGRVLVDEALRAHHRAHVHYAPPSVSAAAVAERFGADAVCSLPEHAQSVPVAVVTTCDVCIEKHAAAARCGECSENMCQAVATVHKQSRASALHSIVQLPSEADAEADANDSDTDADGSRGPALPFASSPAGWLKSERRYPHTRQPDGSVEFRVPPPSLQFSGELLAVDRLRLTVPNVHVRQTRGLTLQLESELLVAPVSLKE